MTSDLIEQLVRSQSVEPTRLQLFHPRVRDRDDIKVLIDPQTEVIVLSSFNHIDIEYYRQRVEASTIAFSLDELKATRESRKSTDNLRRRKSFGQYIVNKDWLDFGCGLGGSLDEMKQLAKHAIGLEPNMDRARVCRNKGHNVISEIDEIPDSSLDCISLFHVFEHLTNPVGVLEALKRKLRPNGVLICEVPHSRDALIHSYECEAFKEFTFWSEHLVLHTRQSLCSLISMGGFQDIEVTGLQRYPLANHLYWLSKGMPGGQTHWRHLVSDALDQKYEEMLERIDRTDSLCAIARA